jgi:hypothetical protein
VKAYRRENFALVNFSQSRENPSGASFSRSARLAAASPPGALRALIRLRRIAKRAFCHGIVQNQQRSATGAVQIKARLGHALLNSQQSRENLSSGNFSRSARLAAASPPGGAKRPLDSPAANRQTRVLPRDGAKSAAFGNGSGANQSAFETCTAEFTTIT